MKGKSALRLFSAAVSIVFLATGCGLHPGDGGKNTKHFTLSSSPEWADVVEGSVDDVLLSGRVGYLLANGPEKNELLYAIDLKSGDALWQFGASRGDAKFVGVFDIGLSQREVVVQVGIASADSYYAFDEETGDILWSSIYDKNEAVLVGDERFAVWSDIDRSFTISQTGATDLQAETARFPDECDFIGQLGIASVDSANYAKFLCNDRYVAYDLDQLASNAGSIGKDDLTPVLMPSEEIDRFESVATYDSNDPNGCSAVFDDPSRGRAERVEYEARAGACSVVTEEALKGRMTGIVASPQQYAVRFDTKIEGTELTTSSLVLPGMKGKYQVDPTGDEVFLASSLGARSLVALVKTRAGAIDTGGSPVEIALDDGALHEMGLVVDGVSRTDSVTLVDSGGVMALSVDVVRVGVNPGTGRLVAMMRDYSVGYARTDAELASIAVEQQQTREQGPEMWTVSTSYATYSLFGECILSVTGGVEGARPATMARLVDEVISGGCVPQ